MSNRQRYFLRNRKGGKTSIYLGGVAKDVLASEEKYTAYVKSLMNGGGCGHGRGPGAGSDFNPSFL